MDPVTYKITSDLVPEYAGRRVIVRTHDPAELVREVCDSSLENVEYVQLLSPDISPESLASLLGWGRDLPVDIVIDRPAADFSNLYSFSNLIDQHPMRATIKVEPGFSKAVKLAAALGFAVKLDVGQPDDREIEEMAEILELYLHRANVTQPIDYFHSVFLSLFRMEPVSLWLIQEEDPEHYSFVGPETVENTSGRTALIRANGNQAVAAADTLLLCCSGCEFKDTCRSYFKYPNRDYDCRGVISLFTTLRDAAEELRQDIQSAMSDSGAPRP